ncbi:MAG: ABC transporter permease [Methanomicrobiaceae archaeon]|uniref:Uncharacterized protein n=1 Tax=hydrocarbon metagenome TaxID=938273 RepID=A0A0W8FDI9_9ZZZZ|nr:ABC transporter permease [Methanomicrobiaceae archaeon]MDD5419679.1 ABC transporter permease subunit [Methanomicrobiaceae archaeon]
MTAGRLLTVARKEFVDHVTSRRFVIILALFLAISAAGMHQGIDMYEMSLQSYNEQMQIISEIEVHGDPGWMPEKPTVMYVFMYMAVYISAFGAVLAIAMGFDLVSKEKESRSLKSLLSHPVFRDEIINGKALGGIAALGFAMGLSILVSLALLLLFSIVPTIAELGSILLYGIVSTLFLITFFALALMMSTVSKESGNALIYTLIIFFALTTLMPMVGSIAADTVAGEQPEPPSVARMEVVYTGSSSAEAEGKEIAAPVPIRMNEDEWERYQDEMQAYWEKRKVVTDLTNLISPQANYQTISTAITNPRMAALMANPFTSVQSAPDADEAPGMLDALATVWMNLAALIVVPSVFFAAAYAAFMRMDIR